MKHWNKKEMDREGKIKSRQQLVEEKKTIICQFNVQLRKQDLHGIE